MSRRHLPRPFPLGAVVIPLLFLLSGCVAGPDWTAIGQQAAQLRASCDSQHSAGTIATNLATEQCANGPIRNLYASAGYPDLDVLDAYFAKREAVAAALDRKAISPEEASAEFAEAYAEMNTMLQQRAASRAVVYQATVPLICDRVTPMTVTCW